MEKAPSFWTKDEFVISTDKSYLDEKVIYEFLSKESYWASERPREVVKKSIANSALCFGIYKGNPVKGNAEQVGFARVISDCATFAYLCDVFVLKPYRGLGLSKWLLSVIVQHPELQFRQFLLATKDAHSLYTKYGFQKLDDPERYMRILRQ